MLAASARCDFAQALRGRLGASGRVERSRPEPAQRRGYLVVLEYGARNTRKVFYGRTYLGGAARTDLKREVVVENVCPRSTSSRCMGAGPTRVRRPFLVLLL